MSPELERELKALGVIPKPTAKEPEPKLIREFVDPRDENGRLPF